MRHDLSRTRLPIRRDYGFGTETLPNSAVSAAATIRQKAAPALAHMALQCDLGSDCITARWDSSCTGYSESVHSDIRKTSRNSFQTTHAVPTLWDCSMTRFSSFIANISRLNQHYHPSFNTFIMPNSSRPPPPLLTLHPPPQPPPQPPLRSPSASKFSSPPLQPFPSHTSPPSSSSPTHPSTVNAWITMLRVTRNHSAVIYCGRFVNQCSHLSTFRQRP
jgi:hypothetical protein